MNANPWRRIWDLIRYPLLHGRPLTEEDLKERAELREKERKKHQQRYQENFTKPRGSDHE